jgi:hypothetical protein
MQIPLLATLLSRFQVCSATVYTAILETSCKAVDCIVRHLSVDVVDEVVLALGGTVRIDAPADLDTGAVLRWGRGYCLRSNFLLTGFKAWCLKLLRLCGFAPSNFSG